jgi:hypothetical protein
LAFSRWVLIDAAVTLEAVLGLFEIRLVPLGRPSGWDPAQARVLYLVHAVIGTLLGIGAVVLVIGARRADRLVRIGSITGFSGIVVAGGGGLMTAYHETRLIGMGLMFIGFSTSFFGYLVPLGGRTSGGATPPG